METIMSTIVLASIGWTLLLTASVVAAVFAVNSKFDALENKFDRKIDGLQDLILQNISPRPGNQDSQ